LIDSHLHLTMMDDIDSVIAEALKEGVSKLLTIGTDVQDSKKVKELASSKKCVLGALGIHPHESKRHSERDVDELSKLISDGIVAIGEIGLDYFKNYSPRKNQSLLPTNTPPALSPTTKTITATLKARTYSTTRNREAGRSNLEPITPKTTPKTSSKTKNKPIPTIRITMK